MPYYAAVFLVVALVAGLFGFGGVDAGASSLAQILFFVFVVAGVVSLVAGVLRQRR